MKGNLVTQENSTRGIERKERRIQGVDLEVVSSNSLMIDLLTWPMNTEVFTEKYDYRPHCDSNCAYRISDPTMTSKW